MGGGRRLRRPRILSPGLDIPCMVLFFSMSHVLCFFPKGVFTINRCIGGNALDSLSYVVAYAESVEMWTARRVSSRHLAHFE